MNDQPAQNTDRELWREREGDYYSDSIHVTLCDSIGINCGGMVIVKPLRAWFALGKQSNETLGLQMADATAVSTSETSALQSERSEDGERASALAPSVGRGNAVLPPPVPETSSPASPALIESAQYAADWLLTAPADTQEHEIGATLQRCIDEIAASPAPAVQVEQREQNL
jgi:hypothetical protein